MTPEPLHCAKCGFEGPGVRTTIVEVDPSVLVAVGDYEVPERFRAESRCLDRTACDERFQPVPQAEEGTR